jgi:hypothetical protein
MVNEPLPIVVPGPDCRLSKTRSGKCCCFSALQNVAYGPSRHFAAAQQSVALGGIADKAADGARGLFYESKGAGSAEWPHCCRDPFTIRALDRIARG